MRRRIGKEESLGTGRQTGGRGQGAECSQQHFEFNDLRCGAWCEEATARGRAIEMRLRSVTCGTGVAESMKIFPTGKKEWSEKRGRAGACGVVEDVNGKSAPVSLRRVFHGHTYGYTTGPPVSLFENKRSNAAWLQETRNEVLTIKAVWLDDGTTEVRLEKYPPPPIGRRRRKKTLEFYRFVVMPTRSALTETRK